MFHLSNYSHFTIPHLPLLFTFDRKIVSHIFPCLLHSVHRYRIPCRLGLSQPDSNTQLLFIAFMARLHHNGIVCSTVCPGIFQVFSILNEKFQYPNFSIQNFSFLILLCCENATYKFRSTMVPIHASFGVATFMLAVATAVTGLTQKAHFELG